MRRVVLAALAAILIVAGVALAARSITKNQIAILIVPPDNADEDSLTRPMPPCIEAPPV